MGKPDMRGFEWEAQKKKENMMNDILVRHDKYVLTTEFPGLF
jgi:hypothetical protein